MSSEEFKARILNAFDQAFNNGNISALDTICTPATVDHSTTTAAGHPNDLEGFKKRVNSHRSGVPDLYFSILYARLANRTGSIGLTGFLLCLIPYLAFLGISVVDLLIWPAIARAQPDLILTAEGELDPSSGLFAATIALIVPFAMLGAVGFILFGIAIWRSGLLPRPAGLLLAIG